jgi:hypothetical protein
MLVQAFYLVIGWPRLWRILFELDVGRVQRFRCRQLDGRAAILVVVARPGG